MTEPWPEPAACAAFDEAAAELALGLLDATVADELLSHVAGCDRCRVELDSLISTADRLTLLAPEAEPPAGFERRALLAMGAMEPAPSHSRRWLVAVAVAAAVVLLASGVALGRWTGGSTDRDAGVASGVASGVLMTRSGQSRGVVSVVRGEHAELVMSLTGLDAGGTYHCSVRTADGHVTEVAAWTIPGSGGGAWKVAIPAHLSGATEAIVTEGHGQPVATATLN
jgi:hypothetical protein